LSQPTSVFIGVSLLLIPQSSASDYSGHQEEKPPAGRREAEPKGLKLNGKLKIYLAVIFIFCLGNSSNTFLLLKAQENGFSSSEVILLYLVFNVSASLLAIPAENYRTNWDEAKFSSPVSDLRIVYLGFAFLSSRFSMIHFLSPMAHTTR
jgi:hypothetical protein